MDDADLLAPRRWDTPFVRNFMLCFGPVSSVFDLLAFALLYKSLHTPAEVFQVARTGHHGHGVRIALPALGRRLRLRCPCRPTCPGS